MDYPEVLLQLILIIATISWKGLKMASELIRETSLNILADGLEKFCKATKAPATKENLTACLQVLQYEHEIILEFVEDIRFDERRKLYNNIYQMN